MNTRPAAALGLVVGGVVGAGVGRIAADLTLALAVAAVYAVVVGVAARWEPVARRRGLWERTSDRHGSLAAGGVVALALFAAVVGVHPALDLDPATTLGLRLLVVGCVFVGLYVGIAVVLLGVEGVAADRDAEATTQD